jgi:hypothetical protein
MTPLERALMVWPLYIQGASPSILSSKALARDAIEPVGDISIRGALLKRDYSGWAGHNHENKNYLKIICFEYRATRPRDDRVQSVHCQHTYICLCMVSRQWRRMAILYLFCLK